MGAKYSGAFVLLLSQACVLWAPASARYVDKQVQQCTPQVCQSVQSVVQQCAPTQICQQVAYQTQQCVLQQQCNVLMQNVPRCSQQPHCVGGRCQMVQSCFNVQVPQQFCQPRQVCRPVVAHRQVCNTVQQCRPQTVTSQQCKPGQCKMVAQRVWEADPSPSQTSQTKSSTPLPSPYLANALVAKIQSNPAITTRSASIAQGYIFPSSMGNNGAATRDQQQCANLVEALRPDVKTTGTWRPAGQTSGNPRGQSIQFANLQPGTPVATFMTTGRYPTGNELMDTAPYNAGAPKEPHSGIFVNYLRDGSGRPVGFEMLAQSEGKPAQLERRLFAPVAASSPFFGTPVENYPYSEIEAKM